MTSILNRHATWLTCILSAYMTTLDLSNGVPGTCDDNIPIVKNASPRGDYEPPFKVNTVIMYMCKEGYVVTDLHPKATCKVEGNSPKWVLSGGRCKRKNCDYPGDIENGRRKGELFVFGESVKYVCYPGYKLSGVETISCKADGTWTGSPPKCEEIEILCPDIAGSPILEVVYPSSDNGRHSVGDRMYFRCNGGETQAADCMRDGKWSVNPPCMEDTCSEVIPAFENAKPTLKSEPPFALNTIIKYRCDPGYAQSEGILYAVCKLQGSSPTWQISESKCRRISCGHPGDITNGKRIGNRFTFARNVTYVCNSGYEMRGIATIFCGTDGEWTHPPPKCVPA